MKFNISRFSYYPYTKGNLYECNFPMKLIQSFKKSFDNLPNDKYINDPKTRQRRYANYHVKNINNKFSIQHTKKTIFEQNVDDSRKEKRTFELIENPYHPFLLNFITLGAEYIHINHPIKELSIDVHQVRQICYPDIDSHNSSEGIHQDGANYIISACVLNRYNIQGGTSYVYDNNLVLLYDTLLIENEFIFQDDKSLYHYVTPIQYSKINSNEPIGYRDIIGLDIKII
tara:strand:- start:489 stop:1175 length:687 start_codon:yes stop_codon:yes gene_type:complete